MSDWRGGPNAEQVAHWNAEESAHWITAADRYDAQLRPLGALAMDAAAVAPGDAVLDIGGGCGQTTLELARRAAPGGRATGVDVSEPMLRHARTGAEQANLGNAVDFQLGDAQVHPFPDGAFDVAFSRFGTLFFADPVAAFANIGGAVRPGGRLAFVAWRPLAEQEWLMVPGAAAAAHVALPAIGGEPGGPGMFAFADPARAERVLSGAGWADLEVRAEDAPITVGGGGDVDETVEFLAAGSIGRALLADVDESTRRRVLDALRDALASHATPAGVVLGAAVWVVSARR